MMVMILSKHMADRTCQRCLKIFDAPCRLKSHQTRKNPCKAPASAEEPDPVDEVESEPASSFSCEKCDKTFTTQQSLYRHKRTVCRHKSPAIPKTMEDMCEEINQMKNELNALKAQESATSLVVNNSNVDNSTTINGDVVNNSINISVAPWVPGKTVTLSDADFVKAFGEPLPAEWLLQMVQEQTDSERGPPFVAAALIALVRQGHEDVEKQNIYLNPRRSDQAIVRNADGTTKCVAVDEATRTMYSDVAKRANDIGLLKVPSSVDMKMKETLAVMNMMFWDDPDGYVKRTSSSMNAHLQNMKVAHLARASQPQILPPPAPQPQ